MDSVLKQKKITVIMVASAIAAVLALLVIWASFQPMALEDVKEITVNVTHADESVYTLTFETTARYLGDALAPYELLTVEETADGPLIRAADGEYAAQAGGAYWWYNANGETAETDVHAQTVEDGGTYDFYIVYGE